MTDTIGYAAFTSRQQRLAAVLDEVTAADASGYKSSSAKVTHGDYEVTALHFNNAGEAWAYHTPTGKRVADMSWGEVHTAADCQDGEKYCSQPGHFTDNVIRSMGVHPDHRRQGVASAMLRAAHEAGATPAHSPARSDAGDAWARSVGGDVPERTSNPNAAFFDPETRQYLATKAPAEGYPETDFVKQARQDSVHPGDIHPQVTYPEIHPEHLSTSDARRSREVTPEEFQQIAHRGYQRYTKLTRRTTEIANGTKGLDDGFDKVVDHAYKATRQPWGGATYNAYSGKPLPEKSDHDLYAMTVREPGMHSVEVSPTASKEEFTHAMHQARGQFGHILARTNHHLGVFHDDDTKSIQIDPVLVTKKHSDVEDIGAYTHAVGGAYNFRDGDGYWPPHVASHKGSEPDMGQRQSALERPRHTSLMRAMQARRAASGEPEVAVAGVAVVAEDTGRVLMIQRSNRDESDPARGKLEFPGGHLDEDGEPAWYAARREFSEETGISFPTHGEMVGSWLSPNGKYQGFVYVVPSEADVQINPDHEDREVLNPDDPDGDDIEVVLWMEPTAIKANPAVRDEVRKDTDFKLLRDASKNAESNSSNFKSGAYDGDHEARNYFPQGSAARAEAVWRRAEAGRGRGVAPGVAGPDAGDPGQQTVRPLTMHPQAVKDLRKLDKRDQTGIVSTIDALRSGDPLVAAQTHPLTGPLSGWYATKSSRGHRVVHQQTPDGGLHVGYVGLHDYGRAVQRLGSYKTADRAQEYHDPELGQEPPKYGWSLTHGARNLYGKGTWRSMFGDGQTAGTPWPAHRFGPGQWDKVKGAVHDVLRDPGPHMAQVDPRQLHGTQHALTREGVAYYLHSPQYRQTGETFADQAVAGNQVPLIMKMRSGKHVILSGHHRAAAALLRGEPLNAAIVHEPNRGGQPCRQCAS